MASVVSKGYSVRLVLQRTPSDSILSVRPYSGLPVTLRFTPIAPKYRICQTLYRLCQVVLDDGVYIVCNFVPNALLDTYISMEYRRIYINQITNKQ